MYLCLLNSFSGSLGYSSYGSMPYRSSLYGSYGTGGYGGSFGSYGSSSYGFGMNGYPYGAQDDAERRYFLNILTSNTDIYVIPGVYRVYNNKHLSLKITN